MEGRPPTSLGPAAVTGLMTTALVAIAAGPLLLPDSYSWIEHGISESAAQGIDGAWPARGGLLLYGLAVLWLVGLRRSTWGPLATAFHTLFGGSMVAVAAFSARPWEESAPFVENEDMLHSFFAGTAGFGFVAGVATLIVVRRQRAAGAAATDWLAFLVTAAVPWTASTEYWGGTAALHVPGGRRLVHQGGLDRPADLRPRSPLGRGHEAKHRPG